MTAEDRAQFESNILQFIKTEVEMGMTFASLALDGETEEKRQRNREHARKAYDTAQHFLEEHAHQKIVLPPAMLEGLTKLRKLLVQMGENFEQRTETPNASQ
jgi:hypothetical protein